MAVLMEQVMPEGVTTKILDEVSEEMGVEQNKPDGLVVHVHFTEDGRTRVVDVWESAEQLEKFRQERLLPAIQKVTERNGLSMDAPPQTSVTEVAGIVRGR
jgi:hypothetical protein